MENGITPPNIFLITAKDPKLNNFVYNYYDKNIRDNNDNHNTK